MNGCRKIQFASRAAVKAWARRQDGLRGGHAYLCSCGSWHWTSMSKAEARRRGLA